ncbi:unnamed protein product [Mytilus edulis]|uniref:Uncharacterized protein n=1 Tax=Mytilus edulis TaxID=6550 RepID=A0A8S3PWG3_MYTED|nr:unnamed protein product [Mytilus edulis]
MYNTLFSNIFSKDSGRTCLSCSGIENLTDCTVIEVCKDDEVCFTHKYTHGPNYINTPELFDIGCTNQKLCIPGKPGSVFGKRGTGRHYVCETCCNNTDICNMKSACAKPSDHKESCELTNKEGNRKCLACNGVKGFLDCTEVETCKSDEVSLTQLRNGKSVTHIKF